MVLLDKVSFKSLASKICRTNPDDDQPSTKFRGDNDCHLHKDNSHHLSATLAPLTSVELEFSHCRGHCTTIAQIFHAIFFQSTHEPLKCQLQTNN